MKMDLQGGALTLPGHGTLHLGKNVQLQLMNMDLLPHDYASLEFRALLFGHEHMVDFETCEPRRRNWFTLMRSFSNFSLSSKLCII